MRTKEKGQSLWEVVIALAIAGLIAVGLVRATGSSVKSARFASDQSRLTALAQGRLAEIIDYKNKNFQTFWGGGFPLQPASMGILREEHNEEEDYCLLAEVKNASQDLPSGSPAGSLMAKITVTVFWESLGEGIQCDGTNFNHKLIFSTDVTNY